MTRPTGIIAAITVVAAVVFGVITALAGPAAAADIGSVVLSHQSGSVSVSPMFASATTSVGCPAGFGNDISLRVGRPGGPFSNIAAPMSGGPFDQGPNIIRPNRSLEQAIGGPPAEGAWEVVVECFSQAQGRHPERMVTPITVTGDTWAVDVPGGDGRARERNSRGALPWLIAIGAGVTIGGTAAISALVLQRRRSPKVRARANGHRPRAKSGSGRR